MRATGIRAVDREQDQEWQIQRSSGTHTEFRQSSLVQKPARTMPPLFSSGSGMRSAGCDGPNGMRFLPGLALVPLGQPKINAPEMGSISAKEPASTNAFKGSRRP